MRCPIVVLSTCDDELQVSLEFVLVKPASPDDGPTIHLKFGTEKHSHKGSANEARITMLSKVAAKALVETMYTFKCLPPDLRKLSDQNSVQVHQVLRRNSAGSAANPEQPAVSTNGPAATSGAPTSSASSQAGSGSASVGPGGTCAKERSQGNVSKDTTAQEGSAQENTSKDTTAKEGRAQENTSKDTTAEEGRAQENTSKDTTAEEGRAQENTSKDTTAEEGSDNSNPHAEAVQCQAHTGMTCELYCQQCKESVCMLCTIMGDHQDHDTTYLEIQVRNSVNKLRRLLNRLSGSSSREFEAERVITIHKKCHPYVDKGQVFHCETYSIKGCVLGVT